MMKKLMALVLASLLTIALCACGDDADRGDGTVTTTTTTTTTAVGEGTATSTDSVTATTTTEGGAATDGTTATTSVTTTTTAYVPGGVTVPIGTKPTTTTTTQKPTATTTNTQVEEPVGTATTTTTTQKPTTTTTTVVKPTQPPADGPYIALPEIGSDIDVTKKKNRIRVSDVAAWLNSDGTIGVSLTFKNYSSNWITEETDYVEYTCYDKDGNVVQKATRLSIGVIDTKKNAEKTFEFSVPADTAEVRLTKSKITYWTEWV
ncbi:MAG: hypothetical protein IJN04_07355 [Clostridia bacterium]|nr:hypothetical protein [Clostridia bacterium]